MIKEIRESITRINISFLNNKIPDKLSVTELNRYMNESRSGEGLPDSIFKNKEISTDIKRLADSYKAFEDLYRTDQNIDTLQKAFRIVNNKFNTAFGNYLSDNLKKSARPRIILFTTSLSCECTLEMCYKQESEIQMLHKELNSAFDYAVIDASKNYEIQNSYDVGVIPTIILTQPNGREIKRFIRDEELYIKIKAHLKKQIKY